MTDTRRDAAVPLTFVVERSYEAAPERVFGAWADREAKTRWFGSPEDRFELDFRAGGREHGMGSLLDALGAELRGGWSST